MNFIYVIHLMCWNYLIDLIHLMDPITHTTRKRLAGKILVGKLQAGKVRG